MYIIYNNIDDANSLIQRIELVFIPCGIITDKYSDVINNQYNDLFAVPIIDIVLPILTETEINNIINQLPNDYLDSNELSL